jgi:Fe-S oxidoreductase
MVFLNVTDPATVKALRKLMIEWGYRGQRWFRSLVWKHLAPDRDALPPSTTGRPKVTEQVIHFMRKPMPDSVPARTARALLGIEDGKVVPILRDPKRVTEESDAVFYFPGCGSERLFSQVGLATLAMLYEAGVQTVLPPGYLCCGYPQSASGDSAKGKAISTANRVLFHRVANTLNYMDIRTVIVSCGTCMDQLQQYEFQQIFPDCRLLDIHEYLMEKGVNMAGVTGVQYLYHDPCHTPMKTHAPLKVAGELLGQPVTLSDRCCGEAGTLAMARPDIATQIRYRKLQELKAGIESLDNGRDKVKLLTSCPACQQGLSRYKEDTGLEVDYIVVELARHRLGENWQERFIQQATSGGIERVLL